MSEESDDMALDIKVTASVVFCRRTSYRPMLATVSLVCLPSSAQQVDELLSFRIQIEFRDIFHQTTNNPECCPELPWSKAV